MLVKKIVIKNYKSLKDLEISNLGNLNIFVGKNDSGKSSILKALDLFFNWTESEDYRETSTGGGGGSALHWSTGMRDYRLVFGQTAGTIEITLFLGLGKEEIDKIFPEEEFNVSNETVGDSIRREELPKEMVIYMQVTVNKDKSSVCSINSMEIGRVPIVKTVNGESRLLTRKNEGNYSYKGSGARPVDTVLTMIRKKFYIIPAVRQIIKEERVDGSPTPDGKLIPSTFFRYEKDVSLGKRRTFSQIRKDVTQISEYQNVASMENGEGRVEVYFDDFPSYSVGEGIKQLFIKSFDLRSHRDSVVGIEEPEIHLHPELQRKLFNFLERQSKHNQIFVTTHSPVFIDKSKAKNVFWVRKINDETHVQKAESDEELWSLLDDIGAKASDVLLSDCIVFVEGASDVKIWKIFARKMGRDLEELNVPVFSLGGLGNIVKLDIDDLLKLNRNFIIVLNSHKNSKEEDVNRVIKEVKRKCDIKRKSCFILEKREIENYFSPRAIEEALHFSKGSIHFDDYDDVVSIIERNAQNEGHPFEYNKVRHGRMIVERMNKKEIKKEKVLGEILKKIDEMIRT